MSVKAIVGANWGDEGKGKITDVLAQDADIVVRFQGGANAGHTIINHYGRFALHLLPSGVFSENITNVIGNGVAFHIPSFVKELASIEEQGVPAPKILVSDRVQLLMPYHILQDSYEEARLAGKAFGSTKSGIAPFYSDKYAKIGIQAAELFDEEALREKVENICTVKNALFVHLYHQEPLKADELMQTLAEYREAISSPRRFAQAKPFSLRASSAPSRIRIKAFTRWSRARTQRRLLLLSARRSRPMS